MQENADRVAADIHASAPGTATTLARLRTEDAIGQLRRRDGLMRTLGSEGQRPMLDWVDGVARLLDHPSAVEHVEAEARALWQRGIRHVVWAGMGGSMLTVRVLIALGLCAGPRNEPPSAGVKTPITFHPLDSTDPAALNALLRSLAQAHHLPAPEAAPTGADADPSAYLRSLLSDVLMVGVAMGMTSEEPITHMAWFADLLATTGLAPSDHLLAMALPGSYLDTFAQQHQIPSQPLQLDGQTGTGGRMSAPTTRVFLLPAALSLLAAESPSATANATASAGRLRALLQRAWHAHDLAGAEQQPAMHPYARLAAALADRAEDGVCRALVHLPDAWRHVLPWIEQLCEESLGKGNRGLLIFDGFQTPLRAAGRGTLHILGAPADASILVGDDHVLESPVEHGTYTLPLPPLDPAAPLEERMALLATVFLGWQLTMALYGYLHNIPFAGQPAVEDYKARARRLRSSGDPLAVSVAWPASVTDDTVTLLLPATAEQRQTPAATLATLLRSLFGEPIADGSADAAATLATRLGYLDLTLNGEPAVANSAPLLPFDWHETALAATLHALAGMFGIPAKLRRAPAAYHATEQSEMDGPPWLVSLRVLAREHAPALVGTYTADFLEAQAVSTWQAMLGQGRACCLLLSSGTLDDALPHVQQLLTAVRAELGADI